MENLFLYGLAGKNRQKHRNVAAKNHFVPILYTISMPDEKSFTISCLEIL